MPRGIAFNIYRRGKKKEKKKETPQKADKAHETLRTAKKINKPF